MCDDPDLVVNRDDDAPALLEAEHRRPPGSRHAMSALTQILARQRAWAASQDIATNPPDYTARLEDNLFLGL